MRAELTPLHDTRGVPRWKALQLVVRQYGWANRESLTLDRLVQVDIPDATLWAEILTLDHEG